MAQDTRSGNSCCAMLTARDYLCLGKFSGQVLTISAGMQIPLTLRDLPSCILQNATLPGHRDSPIPLLGRCPQNTCNCTFLPSGKAILLVTLGSRSHALFPAKHRPTQPVMRCFSQSLELTKQNITHSLLGLTRCACHVSNETGNIHSLDSHSLINLNVCGQLRSA